MQGQKLKALIIPRDMGFSKIAMVEFIRALDAETNIVAFYDWPHRACTAIILSNPEWDEIEPGREIPEMIGFLDVIDGRPHVAFQEA